MGDITVINGGVRGFATGINLLNGSGSSVERVRASSNVRGIDVEGMASGNTATSNAEIGIVVRDGTVSGKLQRIRWHPCQLPRQYC